MELTRGLATVELNKSIFAKKEGVGRFPKPGGRLFFLEGVFV